MNMPKRPDEVALWDAFGKNGEPYEHVIDATHALGIPEARAYYLCCKWANKGLYEWGSFWWLGWKLTEEDQAVMKRLRETKS